MIPLVQWAPVNCIYPLDQAKLFHYPEYSYIHVMYSSCHTILGTVFVLTKSMNACMYYTNIYSELNNIYQMGVLKRRQAMLLIFNCRVSITDVD